MKSAKSILPFVISFYRVSRTVFQALVTGEAITLTQLLLGIVVPMAVCSSAQAVMPVPAGQEIIPYYAAVADPVKSAAPSSAKPLAVGTIAGGGGEVRLKIGLDGFEGPVDVYLGLQMPSISPELFLITETSVQPFSNMTSDPRLRSNATGPIDIALFGSIPVSSLPQGTYNLYLLVSPPGSMNNYYLWSTSLNPSRAGALADSITRVGTDEARHDVLLDVMKELNIGVYSGKGEVIVPGAEQGANDFYLYDFEIVAIANSLGRNVAWSIDDLAGQLSTLSVKGGGPTVTGEMIQPRVATAALAALQNPDALFYSAYRLVREMGLRQQPPYDMAAAVPADQIRLNSLQYVLMLYDALVPLIPTPVNAPADIAPMVPTDNRGLRHAADGPCGFTGNGTGKALKDVAEILEIPVVGDAIKIASSYGDIFHGVSAGLPIEVWQTADFAGKQHAHEGPADPTHASTHSDPKPGEPITFELKVWNHAVPIAPMAECGKLAGYTFPPHGPVAGVPVRWSNTSGTLGVSYSLLSGLGTIVREDSETGSDGTARLVWLPKDEPAETKLVRSSKGHMKIMFGTLVPAVQFLAGFGNGWANLVDMFAPRVVPFPWDLEWHVAGDYAGTIDLTMSGPFSFTARLDVSFQEVPGVQGGKYYDMSGTATLTSGIQYGNMDCSASPTEININTGSGTTELQIYDNPAGTYDLHFLSTTPVTLDCTDRTTRQRLVIPNFPLPVSFGGGQCDGISFAISDINLLDSAYDSKCSQSKAVWMLQKQ